MDLHGPGICTWYAIPLFGIFVAFSLIVHCGVEGIETVDGAWRDVMASIASAPLTDVMNLISLIGSTAFVYSVSLILFVHMWKSRMKESIVSFFSMLVTASLAVNAMKYAFRIPRPPDGLLHVSGYSYPSGHVVLTTVFYFGLAYALYKWGRISKVTSFLFATFVSLAMGLSRTYLSVHYLSDVIGGYLLALGVVAVFFSWLSRSFSRRDTPNTR